MPEISRNRQNARYAEDVVSVKDFGAVGDGVTDDTTAIQDAIDTLGVEGGDVVFPSGVYVCSLVLPSLVSLRGEGINSTTLKKPNNYNGSVIITEDYATLTGTNAWFVAADGVPYGMGIYDLTVDGNSAGSTTGNGITMYAKGYSIGRVLVRDATGSGFYSECGNVVGQADYKDTPEAKIIDLQTRDCGASGIVFRGPHDAIFDRIISNANGNLGFVNQVSSGVYDGHCNLRYIHTYANTNGGIRLEQVAYCGTLFTDGDDLVITADSCIIDSVRNLGASSNGFSVSGVNNVVGTVRGNLLSASTGKALIVDGQNNRFGSVHITGGNGTNNGCEIDANNVQIANFYAADFGGDALQIGTGAARSGVRVDGFVTNCSNGLNYVTQGNRNNIDLSIFTGASQTPVSGQLPNSLDTIHIVEEGDNTSTTYGTYEANFSLDITSTQVIAISHNMTFTPTLAQIQVSEKKGSGVTDYAIDFMRVAAVSATTVTIEIKVGTASATGSTVSAALVRIDTSRA